MCLCHNYWACALEPGSHNYWAHVPQLLKLTYPWARALQQKKPEQWEAHALLEHSPCSQQLEKSMYQQRPRTDNKWIIIKKIIKDNHLYCGILSHGAPPRKGTLKSLSVYISCQYTGKKHSKNIKNKNPPPCKPWLMASTVSSELQP